ncbi:hypothetical protein QLS91_12925, partial [Flavobacterium sp. LB2P84]|uniref:hypothetical protein n=1 Tax=Flavobacterium yafengii TaxID=3041253 RepID=UPI0024A7DA04
MKKQFLVLLLLGSVSIAQTIAPTKVKITANAVNTSAPFVNVQENDGYVNKINKSDLIEVLEYDSAVSMPVTGLEGKIYVTKDNNKIYRWNNTFYNELAVTDISGKVDKVTGKGLSTEDYTTAEKTKLDGIEVGAQVNVPTNLSPAFSADGGVIYSSTGTNAFIPLVTTTISGLASPLDKIKLDGIATGATANSTDAQLRDRTTHTGAQAIATVTGLQPALDAKVDKVTGKSLLSDAEIARLATLANYTHPTNHSPSIITQDASNRFVTDAEKSAWNAKQSAIGYTTENIANKNIANGYAGLGSDGKLIASQLPSITISDTYLVDSQATMLGLSGAEKGDVAVRTDLNKSFILKGNFYSTLADWQELLTPTSAVTTVFGRNGAVTAQTGDYNADQITETTARKFQTANQNTFNDATSSIQTQLNTKQATITAGTTAQYWRGDKTFQTLDKVAVGLGNVDNTTDLNKPISTATQTALNGKQASGSYETAFSKNTAFNKNFGTTAGTVAE